MENIRDRYRREAQPSLSPDETIEAVIPIAVGQNVNRVVVATNKRFAVFSHKLGLLKNHLGTIIEEQPRDVLLGPPRGIQFSMPIFGPKQYVARRFFDQVEAADQALQERGGVERPVPPNA